MMFKRKFTHEISSSAIKDSDSQSPHSIGTEVRIPPNMANDNNNIQPHLVHTHDVQLDADYTQWLVELKARYRSAQIKAAVRVNAEKLLFNWQLGCDLVVKKTESRWGEGIVEQLSLDLIDNMPDPKAFEE